MQEAGVDLVTVGVFSWALLEPREGSFSFDWLRDVLDLLAACGDWGRSGRRRQRPPLLGSPLGTLTSCRSTRRGQPLQLRQPPGHLCLQSQLPRKARAMVARLAAEVGSHPAVEMWHVHNEYACHVPYCYCDNHAKAFRNGLRVATARWTALNAGVGHDVLEPDLYRSRPGAPTSHDRGVCQSRPWTSTTSAFAVTRSWRSS